MITPIRCATRRRKTAASRGAQHHTRPDRVARSSRVPTPTPPTVPGATSRIRAVFPFGGLLRDGKLVLPLERSQIENWTAEQVATAPTAAFDTFCGRG
jgi:hypothetical protein